MPNTPPPPHMDACDREAARKHALEVRRDRARMLADVTAGTTTIATLLARSKTDPIIAQTRVHAVLRALPGWGNARSSALMRTIGIAPGRRCRGLGSRQKSNLLAALESMSVAPGGAAQRHAIEVVEDRRGDADLVEIDVPVSITRKRFVPGELLTTYEAANSLGVSTTTIYRLVNSGIIEIVRVGRSVRIVGASLDDFRQDAMRARTWTRAICNT